MDASQKYLLDSGFYREPRPAYLGAIMYDTKTVLKTPQAEFVKDVVQSTNLDADQAADIYLSFSEAGRLPADYEGTLGDLRGFLEKHRRLDFKDVDSEFNFLAKYGKTPLPGTKRGAPIMGFPIKAGSSVATGVLGSLDSDAKVAAVTTWFGTRPFLTFDLAHTYLQHKYVNMLRKQGAPKTSEQSMLSKLSRTKSHGEKFLQSMVLGEGESFGNLAETRKWMRILTNTNLLTFSAIPAFFSDLVTSTSHLMRLSGRNFAQQLWDVTKHRAKHFGSPDLQRKTARATHVIMSADTKEYMSRFFGGGDLPGFGAWMESNFMKLTGNPWVSDVAKTSNSSMLSLYLGESFKLPWGQLTDFVQNTLQTHRITPDIWEFTRKLPDLYSQTEGVDFIFPDTLYAALRQAADQGKLTRKMAEDIYQGFNTYIIEAAQTKGVPMASTYEHAFFNVDRHNPDSLLHNVAKMVSMYKAVAVAVSRSLIDAGSGKSLGVRNDVFHARFAKVLGMATFFGAIQVLTRDMASGKTPRDFDNVEFWTEAMLRGGTFGMMGDFFFGEHTSYKGGFAGNFLGPVIMGPGYEAQQVVSQLALLEPVKSYEHFKKVIESLIPGVHPIVQLLLNTAFLDTMGDMSGSPKQQQAIRKRLANKGSEYFAD